MPRIPEGQIAIEPSPEDEINVNGTMLREDSCLAALRAGCRFCGLSNVLEGCLSIQRNVNWIW